MKISIATPIICISLLFSKAADATTIYYYTPSSVGNIAGRVFHNQLTDFHQMGFNLSGQSDPIANSPISSWNLGSFTGATVPAPLASYQRGFDSYGGAAVSMYDASSEPIFGVMMNSWNFPYNPNSTLSGTYLQYRFTDGENLRPFSNGANSVLYYSHMLQIPQAYTQSAGRAYVIQGIQLIDNATNRYIWFGPLAFDTGFTGGSEGVELDPGTNAYMVGTHFGSGTQFMTRSNGSYSTTSQTWSGWRWYGYSLSYSQMAYVIQRVNQKISSTCSTCALFSTSPEAYRLGMFYVGGEVTRPEEGNISRNANMGFSSYGHWLYVTY